MPAAIVFSFDPILSVGGFSVRWETIGVAVAAFAAIAVAGLDRAGDAAEPLAPGRRPQR